MKKVICWCFTLLLLTSCIEKNLEIDLKESPADQLSVLAVLRNNLPFTALVSAVIPFNPDPLDYRIRNASVILYEDNIEIAQLTFDTFDQNQDRAGSSAFYSADDTMRLIEGAIYHIEVMAPGYEKIESEGVSFNQVFGDDFEVINEYRIDSNNVAVLTTGYEFSITDATTLGEYVEDGQRSDDRQQERLNQYLPRNQLPFLLFTGRYIAGINLREGNYIRGEQLQCLEERYCTPSAINQNLYCYAVYHLTEHYLKFALPFSDQEREDIGNIGTDVSILPKNIIGGLGYFTVIDSQNGCAAPL